LGLDITGPAAPNAVAAAHREGATLAVQGLTITDDEVRAGIALSFPAYYVDGKLNRAAFDAALAQHPRSPADKGALEGGSP